jgi:hypothetical protein
MAPFAARTRVPIENTKTDIERLVKKFGAKGFSSGWQNDRARVEFLLGDRHIRFTVMVAGDAQSARQRWRALLLMIKARFAAIEAKIVTTEQAFVGDIVTPDGRTVYEAIREPIALAYRTNVPVALLGAN